MPNEARERANFCAGALTVAATAAATTLTSPGFASLPVIGSGQHLTLVLDPAAQAGTPEIVWVTAHTASATTVTVERGRETTTARAHAIDARWAHTPLASDLDGFRPYYYNSATGVSTHFIVSRRLVVIKDSVSDPAWTAAGMEIQDNYAPRISFHQPGVVASSLGQYDGSEDFRTFDNAGTGYRLFSASTFTRRGAYVIGGGSENSGNLYEEDFINRPNLTVHWASDYRYLANRHSGFYDMPPGAFGMPDNSSWWVVLNQRHYNSANNHGVLIAHRWTAWGTYKNYYKTGNGTDTGTINGTTSFSGWNYISS